MHGLTVTADHAIEIGLLPKACRDDLTFWRKKLEPLLTMKRGVVAALAQIAEETETGKTTVTRKFYALKEQGILGLVDRRLAGPRWWNQSAETFVLPESDKALVKRYCDNNDRSSRQSVKQLRADWRKGVVTTQQPVDPRTGYPRGWSIDNLLRSMPDAFEITAARKGLSAAAAYRRTVYTTRKDLWVGSHYMLDDMWHNLFVNSFAEKQAGRPLELFSHDLFSARKVRWGFRIRTQKDNGKMNGLTEAMTRYILAATLYLDGYSPRGTTIVAEHGTAAVNEDVERALIDHIGKELISVDRSGMQGAAAHAGQYPGIVRGNPRMKASLESSNNLTQNVFGDLPGQTGKNRDDRPEHLAARLKDNDRWLALYDRLSPASQALLQFPLLEQNEFMHVAHERYAQMEQDFDHELEGWVEANNIVNELLLGGQWIDRRVLMAGTPAEQEMALALLAQGSIQTRPRRMSRREVWDRGAADLRKMSGAGVVAILGEDLARKDPETVIKGEIVFEDQEVGAGVFRYEAVIFDPWGARQRLPEGEKYRVFVNPFAPDRLFVCDNKLGYLGEARRIIDPSRANKEAVFQAMGAVPADTAERLKGMRERHADEAVAKAERERINLSLEAGAPVTEAEHDTEAAKRREQRKVERREDAAIELGKALESSLSQSSQEDSDPDIVQC